MATDDNAMIWQNLTKVYVAVCQYLLMQCELTLVKKMPMLAQLEGKSSAFHKSET